MIFIIVAILKIVAIFILVVIFRMGKEETEANCTEIFINFQNVQRKKEKRRKL